MSKKKSRRTFIGSHRATSGSREGRHLTAYVEEDASITQRGGHEVRRHETLQFILGPAPDLEAFNGISIGNKTFDFAPSIAFTYTTPPLIAEGTEFGAKLYCNNYATNPNADYKTSSLIDVDFAISEHIGHIQFSPSGVHLRQLADDRRSGIVVLPDGRRIEYSALGSVLDYDIAEIGAAIKIKALTTVIAKNSGASKGIAIGFVKNLYWQ